MNTNPTEKRSGPQALRRQLLARQKKIGRSHSEEYSRPMNSTFELFAHARDHLGHYRTLWRPGRHGHSAQTKRHSYGTGPREMADGRKLKPSDSTERDAIVQCIGGAFIALLTWWPDRGATLPVEQIDALFERFVRDGVL